MEKVLDGPGASRSVQELGRRQWRAIRSKVEVQGVLTAWFHRRATMPRSHRVGSGAGLDLVSISASANLPLLHLPCVRLSALVPHSIWTRQLKYNSCQPFNVGCVQAHHSFDTEWGRSGQGMHRVVGSRQLGKPQLRSHRYTRLVGDDKHHDSGCSLQSPCISVLRYPVHHYTLPALRTLSPSHAHIRSHYSVLALSLRVLARGLRLWFPFRACT